MKTYAGGKIKTALMKILILWLLTFGVSTGMLAQNTSACPCCTEHYQSFDFWLGEWEVKDTTGNLLGNSTIQALEDGCIIYEQWRGAKGTSGRSFNYYDKKDDSWNQLWLDKSGNNLKLKGQFVNASMILTSEITTTPKGEYRNRISWTKDEEGNVIQRWDLVAADKEEILRTIFYGVYTRKL